MADKIMVKIEPEEEEDYDNQESAESIIDDNRYVTNKLFYVCHTYLTI